MKIKHTIIICTLILTNIAINTASAQTGTKKASPSETRKNQVSDDEFLRALQTGDVSNLAGIAAPQFINHGVGEKIGPDSLKASIKLFYSRFKPTKVEVISRTTNGEYFGNWVKFIGANAVIEGIEMTKYSDGKALEHWFFINNQRRN